MTLNPPVAIRFVPVSPAPTRVMLLNMLIEELIVQLPASSVTVPPPAAFTCSMAALIFPFSATLTFSAMLVAHSDITTATAQRRLGHFDLDALHGVKRFMGVIDQ